MEVFTTACPRNCYSTCAMKVHVEGGKLRRIEPHAGNVATAEGPCLKGLSYVERTHSKDRILRPLRRKPGGAPGSFEEISWEVALDEIAERLRTYREDPGPQSVLYYASSGTKGLLNRVGADFFRAYGGYTTTYGDLCWPAGLEATRLTLGDNRHNAPWDLENAKLIVLWGKNAAETNIHQTVFLDRAIERGARVVVIDPRRTQSCERAHLWIQPEPGSDGAIALAVAHRLIEAGHVDRAFVERHVLGFEDFATRAAEYPLERAAKIAGVPVADLETLAEWMGTSPPVTINAGYGIQRYTNSGQTMRAMIALLALTGNIGKPGAGWAFANLQSAVFDTVKDPVAFYPPEDPDGVARVSISTTKLGRHMMEQSDPPLRMAWVERGNPIPQNPNTGRVLEAFRALDFRVVVEQFLTDTAREADLVLPAKTLFEQSDVIGAYWHPYLQLRQKVIDPPGEVKPESEIYRLLARRVGIDADEAELARQFPASDDEVRAFLEERLEPFSEVTLEALAEGPIVAPGSEDVAFASLEFPTPSGKIELRSDEAAERWGVDAITDFRVPEESALEGAERRDYPLYLMTPNTKNRIHSQFNNLAMIRRLNPEPVADLHPEDAKTRGIVNGSLIRIRNDRGRLEVKVRLDPGIRRGCVSLTNGWWITDGGAVNLCSADRETDMGHGAAFHDNLVEVEPA